MSFRDRVFRDEFLLLASVVVLLGPFVARAGFLRDDLGLLAYPPRTSSYAHYQSLMSSQPTMTGRPVSALLHGVCGWTFGPRPWPYHLVNATLFGTSTLLVFHALKRLGTRRVALTTTCFAIAYPCAGGTVFSSIMMNSNLAACFWAGALLLDTLPGRSFRRGAVSAMLLLLSSLSYEAFVPLFLTNVLTRWQVAPRRPGSWQGFVGPLLPMLAALILYGVYHAAVEPTIFGDSHSRISVPGPTELLRRVMDAVLRGSKVAGIDSLRLTIRSIPYVAAFPVATLVVPSLLIAVIGSVLFMVYSPASSKAASPAMVGHDAPRFSGRPRLSPGASMPTVAWLVFLAAQSIYVFSHYSPQSWGFENRTQGAVRFAFAFLVAVWLESLIGRAGRARSRWLAIVAVTLWAGHFVSMVAQREAWIAAAAFNARSLNRVERAIRAHDLDRSPSLTLLTALPSTFPGQLNHEPIFGVSWDIGAALSLAFPDVVIRANVPTPFRTVVDDRGVTIDRTWFAAYPFHVYSDATGSLRLVASADDWRRLVEPVAMEGESPP